MIVATVGNTFGAGLIGLVVSAILYGLTILQTYHYYRTYPRDSKGMKWFVSVMFVADTAHLVICTWCIYWYLVSRFGDSSNLAIPHWTMNLQTDSNNIVGVGVQLFFARRVWRISRQKFLTAVIVVLTIMHGSFGICFTVGAFKLDSFAKFGTLKWASSLGIGSAATADIAIAVSLCYFLYKSRTGFARTDTLLTTLMVYAMSTGLVTSIFATFALVLAATMPNILVWMPFFWCLGRIYIHSLLAMLNSRDMMREVILPADGSIVQLSQFCSDGSKAYRYPTDQIKTSPSLKVTVETTKEQRADYIPSAKIDDTEAQSTTSVEEMPNSPNVHARFSFHHSPPSIFYQSDPITPSNKC